MSFNENFKSDGSFQIQATCTKIFNLNVHFKKPTCAKPYPNVEGDNLACIVFGKRHLNAKLDFTILDVF